MNINDLTIAEASQLLSNRVISAVELTEAMLTRIEKTQPILNSFITIAGESSIEMARKIDIKRQNNVLSPLAGIPIGIKDIILTQDIKTSCASRILENFIPPYDATVISKLKKQDVIIIGKLNMDEFAMGSSNENSIYGPVKNPWNISKTPGGSSGGSAAAVSASQCLGSLGTETGGSVRQPASLCGVVGLKPTYGRVSRYGVIAFASSLDQVGPFGKTVTDVAYLLQGIAGKDPFDSTTVDKPVPNYPSLLKKEIKDLVIGIPKEYFSEGIEGDVKRAIEKAIRIIETLGISIKEISLPHTRFAVPTYYVVATAEASSNLARYDGVKYGYRAKAGNLAEMYRKTRGEGFGKEVKRRIMLGTFALSSGYYDAYYKKASQVRTLIKKDFDDIFKEQCDLIVAPVSPTTAFNIGEKIQDPLQMYLSDIYTISANLAGIPAISVPCGFDSKGLPVGLQILGPHFEEQTLLQLAYAYEQATEWHKKRPQI